MTPAKFFFAMFCNLRNSSTYGAVTVDDRRIYAATSAFKRGNALFNLIKARPIQRAQFFPRKPGLIKIFLDQRSNSRKKSFRRAGRPRFRLISCVGKTVVINPYGKCLQQFFPTGQVLITLGDASASENKRRRVESCNNVLKGHAHFTSFLPATPPQNEK